MREPLAAVPHRRALCPAVALQVQWLHENLHAKPCCSPDTAEVWCRTRVPLLGPCAAAVSLCRCVRPSTSAHLMPVAHAYPEARYVEHLKRGTRELVTLRQACLAVRWPLHGCLSACSGRCKEACSRVAPPAALAR
jgi:hypothetical protein